MKYDCCFLRIILGLNLKHYVFGMAIIWYINLKLRIEYLLLNENVKIWWLSSYKSWKL